MGLELGGLVLVTVLVSAALAALLISQHRSQRTPGDDASVGRPQRPSPVRVRVTTRS